MKVSKLVTSIEYSVPIAGGDGLTFRMEILEASNRGTRRFRLRLYRLEFARFSVRVESQRRRLGPADYRSWVVDDGLIDENTTYPSARAAEEAFRRILRNQIRLPTKRSGR